MPITVRSARAVADVAAADWDRCAGSANPFVSHAFLTALEDSGSVTPEQGWAPTPLVAEHEGRVVGVAPAYLKGHSWGEYVFDQAWAQAWQRAGGRYYPKLLVAVPFSPVPGPRLLVAPDAPPDTRAALVEGLTALARARRLSSVHALFLAEPDRAAFAEAGWVLRAAFQFHWEDQGYGDFEGFLAAMTAHRRKDIRRERRLAAASGLRVEALPGPAVSASTWGAVHRLYQAHADKKWGNAYLGPDFFPLLGERLGERVLLLGAFDRGELVAFALHLQGADTLYGRNWGAAREVPYLHFELCYYRAIDHALAHGLRRVEAGAQGEHKLQRGYLPVTTWSAHWLADRGFAAAVADACARERAQVERWIASGEGPFRAG